MKINDHFKDDIDQQQVMQSLIDFQFKTSKKFFTLQLVSFLIFYILPFLIQLFYTKLSPGWIIGLNILTFNTLLGYLVFELIQAVL